MPSTVRGGGQALQAVVAKLHGEGDESLESFAMR